MTTRLDYCPHCQNKRMIETVSESETWGMAGVRVSIRLQFDRCKSCGLEYTTPSHPDPLQQLYDEYTRITGQPWLGQSGQSVRLVGVVQGHLPVNYFRDAPGKILSREEAIELFKKEGRSHV